MWFFFSYYYFWSVRIQSVRVMAVSKSIIPLRHGGYDHAANTVQRCLQVQPAWNPRSPRSDRVEAGPWGCIQGSNQLRFVVRICWNRCSVLWYATGDHDFCSSRLPLSIKQRGTVWQLFSYFGSLSVDGIHFSLYRFSYLLHLECSLGLDKVIERRMKL